MNNKEREQFLKERLGSYTMKKMGDCIMTNYYYAQRSDKETELLKQMLDKYNKLRREYGIAYRSVIDKADRAVIDDLLGTMAYIIHDELGYHDNGHINTMADMYRESAKHILNGEDSRFNGEDEKYSNCNIFKDVKPKEENVTDKEKTVYTELNGNMISVISDGSTFIDREHNVYVFDEDEGRFKKMQTASNPYHLTF